MIRINNKAINDMLPLAKKSPRGRINKNYHKEAGENIHRMLNIMGALSYIRPHKHEKPDKTECFLILQGSLLVIEFDDHGKAIDSQIIKHSDGEYGVEIPPRTFHCIIPLSEPCTIYEIKDGPYDPSNDKIFAPWAPEEGSPEAEKYVKHLLNELSVPYKY